MVQELLEIRGRHADAASSAAGRHFHRFLPRPQRPQWQRYTIGTERRWEDILLAEAVSTGGQRAASTGELHLAQAARVAVVMTQQRVARLPQVVVDGGQRLTAFARQLHAVDVKQRRLLVVIAAAAHFRSRLLAAGAADTASVPRH